MLMRSEDIDLGRFMEPVARALLGDPNPHLSTKTELCFGSHGSMKIDLEKGTAYSHEENVGGGVLWLLAREKKLQGSAAFEFLRGIGCEVGAPPARAKIVATYDYVDEGGKLLFHVCRFEPKKFAQRAPDGSWAVRGIRQVPYHLPEIIEAIAEDKTIFIVEGEKDANNLARWNIPTTCNAGGAGKWRAEFSDIFRDAEVVVVPHNDAAGRAHANQIAGFLVSIARRVRCLSLPALPAKGDVSDWIAAGGTPETFHALVEAAPVWVPSVESKFGGQRWEDIAAIGTKDGTGYSWLVEDIVPMNEITLAFGDSGTGKSFNVFDLSMSVARGQNFNGKNVEPGLVVYIAAEAAKGFPKRKLAYSMHHELSTNLVLPFYLCTRRPDFFHSDVDVEALIAEIVAVAGTYNVPLVLIVLDTLSALAPGMNENASQDVSMVRARLVRVLEAFNVAVILVHHKPKGGSTPRGHGSLTADFETTIEYETLTDRKTPGGEPVYRGTARKQREGKSGIFWEFSLPVLTVGKNKWGNDETSCVSVPFIAHRATAAGGFHATPNEILFMHALFEALVAQGEPPPPGLPPAITRAVDIGHVREAMRARMILGEEDAAKADSRFRAAFKRAGDALQRGSVIGFHRPLFWYTGKPIRGFNEPEPT